MTDHRDHLAAALAGEISLLERDQDRQNSSNTSGNLALRADTPGIQGDSTVFLPLRDKVTRKLRAAGQGRAARRIEDCGKLPQGGKSLGSSRGRCGARYCPTCSVTRQQRESERTTRAMAYMVHCPITLSISYRSSWADLGTVLDRAHALRKKLKTAPPLRDCIGGIVTTQVAATAGRVPDVHLHLILDMAREDLDLDKLNKWILKTSCNRAWVEIENSPHVVRAQDLSSYVHRPEILEYVDDLSGKALGAVQQALRGKWDATRWGTGLRPSSRRQGLPLEPYRCLIKRLGLTGTDEELRVQLHSYLTARADAPWGHELRAWWLARLPTGDEGASRKVEALQAAERARSDDRTERMTEEILEAFSCSGLP